MDPKYERRTLAQIKELIAEFDRRSPDETAKAAAERLGVYRMQIERWRERVKEWEEAGCSPDFVPLASRTRMLKHRKVARLKAELAKLTES